jgi:HSP20 family molecular chaperone IbpA
LPEGLQTDKADACFDDGVLTLTITEAPDVKPKVIKVKEEKEEGRIPRET